MPVKVSAPASCGRKRASSCSIGLFVSEGTPRVAPDEALPRRTALARITALANMHASAYVELCILHREARKG